MRFNKLFERLRSFNESKICKICGEQKLLIFAHTATCKNCGTLLNFPYEEPREIEFLDRSLSTSEYKDLQHRSQKWHISSGNRNHYNFTAMTVFCEEYLSRQSELNILDYGGGGGQFALIFKSMYPKAKCNIVDMNDYRLLEAYAPMNKQIKFSKFEYDAAKFDFIFLNDVFEHLTLPKETLELLRGKLKQNGKVFIDTPCTFWLYPITKFFSKKIHKKLLVGTVDFDHQQIWTTNSFYSISQQTGFSVIKYKRLSEYTQPPEFYLDNMGIKNPFLRFLGKTFVFLAPFIARNKIMAVLEISKSIIRNDP